MTHIEMLASIFKSLRGSVHPLPIAAAFESLAQALDAGVPPREVAIVARAAAEALRHPGEIQRVRESAEEQIKRTQKETAP